MNEHLDVARLVAVVERAAGLPANIADDWAWVKFLPGQVRAAQRAGLVVQGSQIRLRMWPAEVASQYKFVYSKPEKLEGLVALNDQPCWEVKPNFHLAYWLSAAAKRWYPTRHLDGPTYMRQWITDLKDHHAGRWPPDKIKDPRFRTWLVERRYSSENELAALDVWASQLPRDHFDVRPGIEVTRSWQVDEAARRDRMGGFIEDVRAAINQILTALGEPQLDVYAQSER